ncbi:DUF2520 domain-containing protein [Flavobacteriaceae bacterium Ap0902]|nr:DUF2520 domain-containing protein [Flavobacteriaceae bacterium Ap0902]
MSTVTILGAGNVAHHLARAFVENTIEVKQIYNRTLHKAQSIGENNRIPFTDKISELDRADIFVIASSDSAISELSMHIPFDDALVVHTSGSIPMDILKRHERYGVLYPLQTFSKGRELEYDEIPFYIEASNEEDAELLKKLAKRISNRVYITDSKQRAELHLSAVWASNFVNHMYYIAAEMAEKAGMSFDHLLPLIEETAAKVQDLSPKDAQTGPAKRNDKIVLEKHESLIDNSFYLDLYQRISHSITKTYHDEL